MTATQLLVMLGAIIGSVVILYRRRSGWKRTALGGVVAWFVASLLIGGGEVIIPRVMVRLFSLFGAAHWDRADREQWLPVLTVVAFVLWAGLGVAAVWSTLWIVRRRSGDDRPAAPLFPRDEY